MFHIHYPGFPVMCFCLHTVFSCLSLVHEKRAGQSGESSTQIWSVSHHDIDTRLQSQLVAVTPNPTLTAGQSVHLHCRSSSVSF